MGVREVAWRVRNAAIQRLWRRRRGERWPVPVAHPRWAGGRVPEKAARDAVGAEKVLASARGLLDNGQWPIFATVADLSDRHPDWFRDPATHVRGPADAYCFAIPFRDQARVGNIKHLWEVSRLHHLTVLAAAYHLSGDRRFADRALDHLRSWIQANPPLQGVHWVSGIEIGLRLLAWVWTRRLLDGVPGVEASFENDPLFRRQLHAHQAWIATFHSRGTSANNHLIAEMAGLLAASRAFPVFAESGRWSRNAAACLEREVWRQNFPDGVNREMAGDYHVFVAELFLVAGIEADASGPSLGERYWTGVSRMLDALAATVDVRGNGARQGDGDDARALLLDVPGTGTGTVLEVGATILGRPSWWPAPSARNVGAALLSSMAADHRAAASAPETRPSFFPEAGISILRDLATGPHEIWCRFDHGPHGFLATAAHAHADALSFELRFGGQEILVDPGTYCYHGETEWRNYFRSTLAHNTLELGGASQAKHAGAFLWRTRPDAELLAESGLADGPTASVEACHDGYLGAAPWAKHRRRLVLDRTARSLAICDWIEGPVAADARLAFHLHPSVECRLEGARAILSWAAAGPGSAVLALAPDLLWSVHCGETDPILGWYSPHFGGKTPTLALIGQGRAAPGKMLRCELAFIVSRPESASPNGRSAAAEGVRLDVGIG